MNDSIPLFRYSDIEDNSLWVLEDQDNIYLFINAKKIILPKGKVLELKQSLDLWLKNKLSSGDSEPDTDPAPHHGCQCNCHNLIDSFECSNCQHDYE